MIERVLSQSQIQTAKMELLRTVHGVTLRNKVGSYEIRWALNVKSLSEQKDILSFDSLATWPQWPKKSWRGESCCCCPQPLESAPDANMDQMAWLSLHLRSDLVSSWCGGASKNIRDCWKLRGISRPRAAVPTTLHSWKEKRVWTVTDCWKIFHKLGFPVSVFISSTQVIFWIVSFLHVARFDEDNQGNSGRKLRASSIFVSSLPPYQQRNMTKDFVQFLSLCFLFCFVKIIVHFKCFRQMASTKLFAKSQCVPGLQMQIGVGAEWRFAAQ